MPIPKHNCIVPDLTGYITSPTTRARARIVYGKPNFILMNCDQCGKPMAIMRNARATNRRFCSQRCFGLNNRTPVEYQNPRPAPRPKIDRRLPVLSHCVTCGRPIHSPNVKYCMVRCRPNG